MQKFIPKAIPMYRKLLKSPGARTVAFILVIAISIIFVQQNFKSNDLESQSLSTWDDSEKNAPDINGPDKGVTNTSNFREVKNVAKTDLQKAENFVPTATSTGTLGPKSTNSWQIIFLEVPRNAYEEHLAPLESFADGSMHGGIVSNSEDFLKNLKGVRELLKESKTLKIGEPWEIFKGIRNFKGDDQDLGLHIQLQVGEPTEAQNVIQFSYISQIPIIADRKIASVEPQGLTDSVKLPIKGGLFLTGGISRKAGGEDTPLTGAPFEILQSSRFKLSESEFVILILSK